MRVITDKKHFTKAERKFARWLNENHIPFKTKAKVANKEIDFLIGKYIVEIDGHEQDGNKNSMLVQEGFIPLHYTNQEINNKLYEFFKFS